MNSAQAIVMRTIGEVLQKNRGIGPGFDAVRLGLACTVLFIHTSLLAPGIVGQESAPLFPGAPIDRWAFNYAIMPMFFALSGFLIAASAERLSLGQFLINRGLRIAPALAVETALCALLLGPWLTTLPLAEYFRDGKFFTYFLNIFGVIHYELPGLFEHNPEPNIVNGSLWTVPHELACYALLTGLLLTGLYRRNGLLVGLTAAFFGAGIVVYGAGHFGWSSPLQEKLSYFFVTRGAARLVPMFLVGILLYRFRYTIPLRGDLAATSIAFYIALSVFGSPAWLANPLFAAATAFPLGYAVVYAGLSPALRLPQVLRSGDYSYGIYLYGFPIQQTILLLWPDLRSVPLFFIISLLATSTLAALSWRYIERPVLGLRRKFSLTARIHAAPDGEAPRAQAETVAPAGRRPATT